MKISHEIKVALLVIVSLILLYFGYNFIRGSNVLSSENTYYAVYQNVNGLLPGNQVKLNGLKVGMVKDCYFTDDKLDKIVVMFAVDSDLNLPSNTEANIEAADLLGDMEVNLSFANGIRQGSLQNGDTLKGQVIGGMVETLSEEILPVKDKLEQVMVSADSLINTFNGIAGSGRIDDILVSVDETFDNLLSTSKSLNGLMTKESQALHQLIQNFASISEGLVSSSAQLNTVLANAEIITKDLATFSGDLNNIELNKIADELSGTLTAAKGTMTELNATLELANNQDGTIGKLLKDPELYNNLEQTMGDLDKLLLDLKENPKRYVQFSLIQRKDKSKKEKND